MYNIACGEMRYEENKAGWERLRSSGELLFHIKWSERAIVES